jgi:hypothetical protein
MLHAMTRRTSAGRDPLERAIESTLRPESFVLKILMDLCDADLRCLDAHAHLGTLVFDSRAADAVRHYEVGVRIGELSLGLSACCG